VTPGAATCLRPGEAKRTRCGAELHNQPARVCRRGLEVVGTIEARCALIHRVDYDEAPASGARGHDDRGQGVPCGVPGVPVFLKDLLSPGASSGSSRDARSRSK
jgi:hypothetical protein